MGTLSEKLTYLAETKRRLYAAMDALGYGVTAETTFRDAVNLLYSETFDDEIAEYDYSLLPSYYVDPVKGALKYALMLGEGYIHHVIITDSHFPCNYNHSPAIVKTLQNTGLFSKVLNLGDFLDAYSGLSTAESYFSDLNGEMLYAIGNHEPYTDSEKLVEIYNAFLSDFDNLQGTPQEFNYYWDDAVNHVRYIVVNNVNQTASWNKNPPWFSWVTSLPSGWTFFILSHYQTHQLIGLHAPKFAAQGLSFAGSLTGHMHYDALYNIFGGAHIATFLNDGTTAQYNPDNTINTTDPKIENTDNDAAVTVMSFNPTTKDVQFYRIGNYYSMPKVFSYKYAPRNKWTARKYISSEGQIALQRASNSLDNFTYESLIPLKDNDSNDKRTYIYVPNGKTINRPMIGLFKENGDFMIRREFLRTFPNIVVLEPTVFYNPSSYPDEYAAMKYAIATIESTGLNLLSEDEIKITEQMPMLFNSAIEDIEWELGYYRSYGQSRQWTEPATSGDTERTKEPTPIVAGANYKLYFTDGTKPSWCRLNYADAGLYGISDATPSFNASGELYFTVPNNSDIKYLLISLTGAIDHEQYLRLEAL